MICRARPKYVNKDSWVDKKDICNLDKKGYLYFTSGSKGLEFFLKEYVKYYDKTPTVILQTFTCSTMLYACLNAKVHLKLFDISLEDCSLCFESIKKENADIIILTHYQGIPNRNYEKFKNLCERKNILLIEDLAHGDKSYIDGVKIGTYANIIIESYAWDKPYTALRGGALKINSLNTDFEIYMKNHYEKLPKESDKKAIMDIKTIKFLMDYTKDENYQEDFDYMLFINMPILQNMKVFWKFKMYRKILKCIYIVCQKLKPKVDEKVTRMSDYKVLFVDRQRRETAKTGDIKKKILEICSLEGVLKEDLIFFDTELNYIYWNRFSVIDKKGMLTDVLRKHGISAGNFNWDHGIQYYIPPEYKEKMSIGEYKNTDYLARHIVNIPNWNE